MAKKCGNFGVWFYPREIAVANRETALGYYILVSSNHHFYSRKIAIANQETELDPLFQLCPLLQRGRQGGEAVVEARAAGRRRQEGGLHHQVQEVGRRKARG